MIERLPPSPSTGFVGAPGAETKHVGVDAAPLVALADEREPRREEIIDVIRSERRGLFIPAPVTAEID